MILQGEAGWDTARLAWNLSADQRPPLVVLAESPRDIAATVRFAAANGLRVAPQSTGHGARQHGRPRRDDPSEDIKAERCRRSTRDAQNRHGGGGRAGSDVVAPAAEHGLVGLHGMSASVGVAGYLLGGGIGWLTRREGFASTHVRAFEVVAPMARPVASMAQATPSSSGRFAGAAADR